MAPENELLSSWREELLQQASQGSGREEELEGGGEEQEGEIEMLDENSNVEKTITDSESEEQFRASLRREKNRKKRQRSGEDGGGDDSVPGNIPVDLLRRISPLCEKLGLSMRQQLAMTMGFAELCGELKHMGCFSRHINIISHSNLLSTQLTLYRSGLNPA